MSTVPTIFTLFGATGDLSKRKVMPAFYELGRRGLLPQQWVLIGNGRKLLTDDEFRDQVRIGLEKFADGVDEDYWPTFARGLRFAGGGFDSESGQPLLQAIEAARGELGVEAQLIHYLAVPPVAFTKITKGLAAHQLLGYGARVVFEKPYGTSSASFSELDELVSSVMSEEQVYRIDHFLGKEAVQNLHVLRHANSLFSEIWNAEHIAQVQIDAAETLDVADRAEFYDATGAFRDMIASHLFQVAAEVAMEPPASMSAADLLAARESVIGSFCTLTADDVEFGQYEGYLDLPDVAPGSITDTYAACRLFVDTDRWRGVPFVLRSGKSLGRSGQRVSLVMRKPVGPFARQLGGEGSVITVSLDGPGVVTLDLLLKRPGPELELADHRVTLKLESTAVGQSLPAYVALIHDVTMGDRSLFTSSAGLAHAWRVADRVIADPPAPAPYEPGSSGPAGAARLAEPYGWLADAG